MKYLTSDGKIISGNCKTELLVDLKNSFFYGINRKWENFLEVLSLELYLYHRVRIDQDDVCGIIDQLEDIGILLRIE